MTPRQNGFLTCLLFLTILFLTSCATTSSQSFMMSFLPPAPRQAVTAAAAVEAPVISSNLYLTDTPSFLKPNLEVPARPSQADLRIRRADDKFRSGKSLYQAGDIGGARSEFDKALDILLGTPEDAADRIKVEQKVEQLVATIHRYDVNGMGSGDFSGNVAYDKAPLEDILEMTFPVDPQLKPKVKEQLQATVSQLPLETNDAVVSYIKYFSTEKGRRTLLAGLRRAGKYKPLISGILAEEGVPQELIYLAQAESGFLPRAVSHKAAVGMWQFVRARGREYGLTQTANTDDRLDPEKATRSAARHLRDLYQKFGDWYLAIAGYNCGDGCVERAVQRTGYADFWTLREKNAVPRETTNYVPIILAMTIMHKNASAYGLEDIDVDPALTYETVELEAPTHLALVADAADRAVSDLRELNPALLTNVAPARFSLRVPKGTKSMVLSGLETIPPERRASWRIHRVGEGDTLESIAKRYKMPVRSIEAANALGEAEIGDVLIIPTATQLERMKAGKSAGTTKSRSSSSRDSVRKPGTHSSKTSGSSAKPAQRRIARGGVHANAFR
jgi:membrane-bound lytic murein transglycosylase D